MKTTKLLATSFWFVLLANAIVGLLLLAACATTKTVHDVQTVDVAVSTKCLKEFPPQPKLHTDEEIKAMPDYKAIWALLLDRTEQAIYKLRLEAATEGCK